MSMTHLSPFFNRESDVSPSDIFLSPLCCVCADFPTIKLTTLPVSILRSFPYMEILVGIGIQYFLLLVR
jgi:hypothetical protein